MASLRLQGAMEYLMTYGWVIMILVVVLVAVYALGVFNPQGRAGATCILQSGFTCTSFLMNTSGFIRFTLTQSAFSSINVTGVACYSNSTHINYAAPLNPPSNQVNIQTGASHVFYAQCYTATNSIYTANVAGNPYQGYIAIKYVNRESGFSNAVTGGVTLRSTLVGLLTSTSSTSTSSTSTTATSTTSTTVASTSSTSTTSTSTSTTSTSTSTTTIYLYAYVTNWGSSNVQIVDTTSNTAASAVSAGGMYSFTSPSGVSVAPNGQYAYVSDYSSTAEGGAGPTGSYIEIVNTATNAIVSNINNGGHFDGLYDVAIAPNGQYAYAPNEAASTVAIITTTTNAFSSTITTSAFRSPWGVAFAPNGQYAYVTNIGGYNHNDGTTDGNVVILSTATNTVVGQIYGGIQDPEGVAFAPNGQYAYISNTGSPANIVIVSTSTNTVVGVISSGAISHQPTNIAFSPTGSFAYVANSNNVLIINTATNAITGVMTGGVTNAYGVGFPP